MNWQYVFTSRAERDFERLDATLQRRIIESLERLAAGQRGDVSKIIGSGEEWRLRVGVYRVRFRYDRSTSRIVVLRIRHRREAY